MSTKLFARRGSGITAFIALAIAGLTISFTAEAQPVGSLSFSDTSAVADGSDTGNLNTATSFMFADVSTTGTGVFAGLPTQSFSSVSFNLTDPTSLSFSSSEFGSYTSTSITEEDNFSGFVDIATSGNWTPGTYSGFSGLSGSLPASMSITLTQNPATDGIIAGGDSFSISPTSSSPEPATSWLLGMSLAALAGIAYSRRKPERRKRAQRPEATAESWYEGVFMGMPVHTVAPCGQDGQGATRGDSI